MDKKPSRHSGAASRSHSRRRRKKGVSGVGIFFIVFAAVIVLVAALAVGAGYMISKIDTSLPNVYAGGIYVGGMSEEEILQTLNDAGWDKTYNERMRVYLPLNVRFSAKYLDAGINLNAEKAAHCAYSYGHTGNMIENVMEYIRGTTKPIDILDFPRSVDRDYVMRKVNVAVDRLEQLTSDGSFTFSLKNGTITGMKGGGEIKIDREAFADAVVEGLQNGLAEMSYEIGGEYTMPDFQAMHDELYAAPADAAFDPDTFEVSREVVGVEFSVEEAKRLWTEAKPTETVTVPVIVTQPNHTAEELEGLLFRDLLGEQTTYMWGSTASRINNIALVAEKINGYTMLPGETFSYNSVVGQRTAEAGFEAAGAYNGGEVVQEIGGGICQGSSTLYNAVMKAQLDTIERECHYFPVGYLPQGLDATVSWPGPDYKFVNNREYPIKIVAWVDRGKNSLTIQIYGTNTDGTYMVPYGFFIEYEYDSEQTDVAIGYHSGAVKYLYDADGNKIGQEYESNSYYHYHDEDIKWHTEEEEAPAVVPESPEGESGGGEESGGEAPAETPTEAPAETGGGEESGGGEGEG